jgi:tetraacyldisaccharide 4'-kinase
MRLIEKVWFHQHKAKYWLLPLLLPFSLLFMLLSAIRRFLYRTQIFKAVKLPVPVIVVGNISVGGNGKTPMVLWLIEQCQQLGLTPGVVSRGYGGKAKHYPLLLNQYTKASESGDEPLMIYQRSKVSVAVGSDRIAAAKQLIEQGCDVIIADDGLQHYRLARDIEFIIVDSKRLFGNGLIMPMGPLRENVWRLATADFVVLNGKPSFYSTENKSVQALPKNVPEVLSETLSSAMVMNLATQSIINCATGESQQLTVFQTKYSQINALAGIGSPQRFFDTLTACAFEIKQSVAFVDHHQYKAEDFHVFDTNVPLLMTEKDAVKCTDFAQFNWWYVPVDAQLSVQDSKQIINKIKLITNQRE